MAGESQLGQDSHHIVLMVRRIRFEYQSRNLKKCDVHIVVTLNRNGDVVVPSFAIVKMNFFLVILASLLRLSGHSSSLKSCLDCRHSS